MNGDDRMVVMVAHGEHCQACGHDEVAMAGAQQMPSLGTWEMIAMTGIVIVGVVVLGLACVGAWAVWRML